MNLEIILYKWLDFIAKIIKIILLVILDVLCMVLQVYQYMIHMENKVLDISLNKQN